MSDEWWSFYPQRAIKWTNFDELYEHVDPLCHRYPIKMYDKVFTSRRRSCVFKFHDGNVGYTDVKIFEPPKLFKKLHRKLLKTLNTDFDYVLVHIYEDGSDYIGWHNDSEALNGSIASLSFGATRKFRFRPIADTKGWCAEYTLESGDLLHMHTGCQQRYKHTVPATKRCKLPRINLTFRQY